MKIFRYVLFCILILILSIYLRRPADMPGSEWNVVDQITSLFSQDEEDDDENGEDEEEDDDEDE